VDAATRAAWRAKLKRLFPEHCPVCKIPYEDQVAFNDMPQHKLVRHSECGHVLMWREGIELRAQHTESPPRPPSPPDPFPRANEVWQKQTPRQPKKKEHL
jgi:hypothetical protein